MDDSSAHSKANSNGMISISEDSEAAEISLEMTTDHVKSEVTDDFHEDVSLLLSIDHNTIKGFVITFRIIKIYGDIGYLIINYLLWCANKIDPISLRKFDLISVLVILGVFSFGNLLYFVEFVVKYERYFSCNIRLIYGYYRY